jgi:hypothetical protein
VEVLYLYKYIFKFDFVHEKRKEGYRMIVRSSTHEQYSLELKTTAFFVTNFAGAAR